MGLATPPLKNKDATETNTREHDVNGTLGNEEPQTLGMMTDGSQTQPDTRILKMDLQGDVETIGRVGDKGERMELGAGGEVGEGHATLVLPGNGIMRGIARRGLRDY